MSFRFGMDVIVYFDGFGQMNWLRPAIPLRVPGSLT